MVLPLVLVMSIFSAHAQKVVASLTDFTAVSEGYRPQDDKYRPAYDAANEETPDCIYAPGSKEAFDCVDRHHNGKMNYLNPLKQAHEAERQMAENKASESRREWQDRISEKGKVNGRIRDYENGTLRNDKKRFKEAEDAVRRAPEGPIKVTRESQLLGIRQEQQTHVLEYEAAKRQTALLDRNATSLQDTTKVWQSRANSHALAAVQIGLEISSMDTERNALRGDIKLKESQGWNTRRQNSADGRASR
jgi:hypothetical protein